jgi:hypothetical protein
LAEWDADRDIASHMFSEIKTNWLEQEVVTAQMRVQKLETECPSDWSPMKNELDDLFGTIGSSVDRAWRDLSPGEVGG